MLTNEDPSTDTSRPVLEPGPGRRRSALPGVCGGLGGIGKVHGCDWVAGRLARALSASAMLVLSLSWSGSAAAQAPAIEDIDAARALDMISETFARARQNTLSQLAALGVSPYLGETRAVGTKATVGHAATQTADAAAPLGALSPIALLESLYARAEAAVAGEGRRFLAALIQHASRGSAALAVDPELAWARAYPSAALNLLRRPIRFAAIDADIAERHALPRQLRPAARKLAEIYAGPGLADSRGLLLRHLRRAGFNAREFERVLAGSRNARQAVEALLAHGTPPPKPQEALRDIFIDTMAASAALSMAPDIWRLVDSLSRGLPPPLTEYVRVEGRLASRILQMHAVQAAGKSTQAARSGPFTPDPAELEVAKDRFEDWQRDRPTRRAEQQVVQAKQDIERDVQRRVRIKAMERNARPKRNSIWLTAKRQGQPPQPPLAALWAANRSDDRFGRLFVLIAKDEATAGIPAPERQWVVTRTMFADSFFAAADLVFAQPAITAGQSPAEQPLLTIDRRGLRYLALHGATQFSDPALRGLLQGRSSVYLPALQALRSQIDAAAARPEMADDLWPPHFNVTQDNLGLHQHLSQAMLQRRLIRFPQTMKAIPELSLDLVVHPALVGREVAWSAARAEFWLWRSQALLAEAALQSTGPMSAIPAIAEAAKLDQLPPADQPASWGLYDRDYVLQWASPTADTGGLGLLEVKRLDEAPAPRALGEVSATPQPAPGARQGHTTGAASAWQLHALAPIDLNNPNSVTDFHSQQGLPDQRLNAQEQAGLPLLQWLGQHHHDFMRLTDLADAHSLLQWLRAAAVRVRALDLDGPGTAIATPERFQFGPHAGPRTGPGRVER